MKTFPLGLFMCTLSALAAPPTVTLISPRPPQSAVNPGDLVYLRADAQDSDGQVARVEFYNYATNLLAVATSAPFSGWWLHQSNAIVSAITAVAIDDAMERTTSAVVNVFTGISGPRILEWMPPGSPSSTNKAEWNTRDFNWAYAGSFTHFRPESTVRFNTINPAARIFIGVDGMPTPVMPGGRTVINGGILEGGDIVTGGLDVNRVVFTNYAGSLSFPAGTRVMGSGNLTYNIARAPQGAVVHFGTGPITLDGNARFEFGLMTNQQATLENDFGFAYPGSPCNLTMGSSWLSNAAARFTGTLNLGGMLRVDIHNGVGGFGEGQRDADYHEWAGPIVLDQSRPMSQFGFYLWGSYRSKGLLLSGHIKDGHGVYTNRLVLQTYAVPVIRLTGSNTYAHGTLIDHSPSAPQGWVEVAPESSLGAGNVEVRGPLHLMGNRNIRSNASVNIAGGRLIIDSGVKVRVSRLSLLGAPTYTVGIFTQTNSPGWFRSNGTLRLPAVNIPPSITLTNPLDNAELSAADPIRIRASVSDPDSYIERVEFYVNGGLAGIRTNAPYNLSISNAPLGIVALQAVVYDDDGASTPSPTVRARVAPHVDSIQLVDTNSETNLVVIEFRTPRDQFLVLEASDSLSPTAWSTLGSFQGSPSTTTYTVTNAIPAEARSRFYRLRTP